MKVALVKVAFVPWMLLAMSRASVELQVKAAFEERLVALVQKATWFAAPLPVRFDPPTQTEAMAKQPPDRSIPNVPVEVAVCEKRVNEIPAAKVEVAVVLVEV